MRAKPANQQRSQDKRDRILVAMDALLREKSFSDINISDIAAEADVSPATIYQRFNNEDAAASVLLELYYQRVEEWAMRPRGKKPPKKPSLFEALVMIGEDAWEQINQLQHIMRPAYLYSRQRPDLVGADWARLESMAAQGFQRFLEIYAGDIRTDDMAKAAGTLCYFFNFMIIGKLLHGDETNWPLLQDRKAFARELANLAHPYLTIKQEV